MSKSKSKVIGSLDRGKMEFIDLSIDLGVHRVVSLKYGTKGITLVTSSTRRGATLAMFVKMSSTLFNALGMSNSSFGEILVKVSSRGSSLVDTGIGGYRFNGSSWEYVTGGFPVEDEDLPFVEDEEDDEDEDDEEEEDDSDEGGVLVKA